MSFRETGFVVRKFVAPSGKFGSLVLDVTSERDDGNGTVNTKIDFVTYKCANDLVDLTIGAEVTVSGRVGMTKLVNKDKSPVQVGGFDKWVPQLTISEVTVAGASRKAAAPKDDPANDDDIPF